MPFIEPELHESAIAVEPERLGFFSAARLSWSTLRDAWRDSVMGWRLWRDARPAILLFAFSYAAVSSIQWVVNWRYMQQFMAGVVTGAPLFMKFTYAAILIITAGIAAMGLYLVHRAYAQLCLRHEETRSASISPSEFHAAGVLFIALWVVFLRILALGIGYASQAFYTMMSDEPLDLSPNGIWELTGQLAIGAAESLGISFMLWLTCAVRLAIALQSGRRITSVAVILYALLPMLLLYGITWVWSLSPVFLPIAQIIHYDFPSLSGAAQDGVTNAADARWILFSGIRQVLLALLHLIIVFYFLRLFWKRDFPRARQELFRRQQCMSILVIDQRDLVPDSLRNRSQYVMVAEAWPLRPTCSLDFPPSALQIPRRLTEAERPCLVSPEI